jgi:hypothetical protein
MSLPAGVAKSDSGAVFILRDADELAGWTDDDLRMRLRYVQGHISSDGAGLAFLRSYVRNTAIAERKAVLLEMARRGVTR